MASAKALARQLGPVINKTAIDISIAALVARWQSEEATEGIATFFDNSLPSWAKR